MELQGRDVMPRGDSSPNWGDSRTGFRLRTRVAADRGSWKVGTRVHLGAR